MFLILRLIPSTRSIALDIQWIVRLLPSFCFGYGVLNIGNRVLYSQIFSNSKKVPSA